MRKHDIAHGSPAASLKSGASDRLDRGFRSTPLFRIMELVEPTKSRVLIVDHNMLLREGLRSLIHLQPDMELAGVATSASEAMALFREHRPQVVLMDLDLPELDGFGSIRKIRKLDPAVCILGLLTYPWEESAVLALREGAQACIGKDRLNRDLVALIRKYLRQ
jgi:DNA-binding NarL/FixJ family response regulator